MLAEKADGLQGGSWRRLCINSHDGHTEHQNPSTTTSQQFFFVLDCVAVPGAPRPQSTAQIFELECSQVDLARSTAFCSPVCFDETPGAERGLSGRAHCAPRLPHSISRLVGFKSKQAGLRGRQPHERGLRPPHHHTQMQAQDFNVLLLAGEDQSFWVAVSEEDRGGRLLQRLRFQKLILIQFWSLRVADFRLSIWKHKAKGQHQGDIIPCKNIILCNSWTVGEIVANMGFGEAVQCELWTSDSSKESGSSPGITGKLQVGKNGQSAVQAILPPR